ncbi:MAG: RDD family protein [Gaiellaceae bacterium]
MTVEEDQQRKPDDAALGVVVATAGVGLAAARMLARTPGLAPYLERAGARGREQVEGAAGRLAVEFEPEAEKFLQQFLDSPAFDQALERVLTSPKVREALAQQTTTFADELLGKLRARLRALDRRYAGLPSRTAAFAVDLTLAQVIFLIVTALAGLVVALVGDLRPAWLFGMLAGSEWLLLVGAYFVFFWSLAGQTPGMRLLHLRVDHRGAPPRVARAIVRFAALIVAIIPMLAGLLPILFDKRRRGLHDFAAQTVVVPLD